MEKERMYRLLEKRGISPNVALDQHFMTDPALIRKIVSLAGIKPRDTVLEIGSGIGILTREIAKKAGKVIALEIDKKLLRFMRCPGNVEPLAGNALKLISGLKFDRLVSNTPYSICEPLIQKLARLKFQRAVLTLPDGFIQRLQSDSMLGIFAGSFFRMEEKLKVPRKAFCPPPKVESGVLVLSHKTKSEYKKAPEDYVMKKLFLQGDRKLRNALRDGLIDLHRDILGKEFTKRQAREIIESLKIPEETLEKPVKDLNGEELQDIREKCKGLTF